MNKVVYNRKRVEKKRQDLRKKQTESERIMWQELRNRSFIKLKFRRQYSIGEYIVDFYCPKLRVVLEIDGESHFTEEGREYDKIRTQFMEQLDIKVIRFTNKEVMENIEGVLKSLKSKLK